MQDFYLVIVEKREESRCLDVFGREIKEKRKRIFLENCLKSSSSSSFSFLFFFLQNEGSGSIYSGLLTLQLLETIQCVPTNASGHTRSASHLC